MNYLQLTFFIGFGSALAGFLGALTGLGGGVVIVPMLTLVFGMDLRYAVGASLVSVIATSSGAAAAYVREGYSNIRIAVVLEVATTTGALIGAYLAGWLPTSVIAVVFGLALLHSALASGKTDDTAAAGLPRSRLAESLQLNGSYPSPAGVIGYHVRRVPLGFFIMLVAGALSGLLGIGSGAMKVLAMDRAMGMPFKVSATTSNFMIGVTAAASAGVYLSRGYIDPAIAAPVVVGVLHGSMLGARVLAWADTKWLRRIFSTVITILALQMIYKGIRGGL